MSSLYYTVKRDSPLSDEEKIAIKKIVDSHLSNEEVISLNQSGGGELFSYNLTSSSLNVILEGATNLPVYLFPDDLDDFIYVTEHWFDLLSELRKTIHDAEWDITLDGQPLFWNEIDFQYEHPRRK